MDVQRHPVSHQEAPAKIPRAPVIFYFFSHVNVTTVSISAHSSQDYRVWLENASSVFDSLLGIQKPAHSAEILHATAIFHFFHTLMLPHGLILPILPLLTPGAPSRIVGFSPKTHLASSAAFQPSRRPPIPRKYHAHQRFSNGCAFQSSNH